MTVWRVRLRLRGRVVAVPATVETAAHPDNGGRQAERQAVSPEQFDRPQVYVLGPV